MSHDRINKAKELLQRFPDNELARYSLAQAYFDDGDMANAAQHLRPLCDRKPDWMVVHILLGKCLLAEGKQSEAKPILEHARDLAEQQHHEGPLEELTELLKTL